MEIYWLTSVGAQANHTGEVERLRKLLDDRDAAHQAAVAELRHREQEKAELAARNYEREIDRLSQHHDEAQAQMQKLQAAARDSQARASQVQMLLASAVESVHALVALPEDLISMVSMLHRGYVHTHEL